MGFGVTLHRIKGFLRISCLGEPSIYQKITNCQFISSLVKNFSLYAIIIAKRQANVNTENLAKVTVGFVNFAYFYTNSNEYWPVLSIFQV